MELCCNQTTSETPYEPDISVQRWGTEKLNRENDSTRKLTKESIEQILSPALLCKEPATSRCPGGLGFKKKHVLSADKLGASYYGCDDCSWEWKQQGPDSAMHLTWFLWQFHWEVSVNYLAEPKKGVPWCMRQGVPEVSTLSFSWKSPTVVAPMEQKQG